MTAVIAEPKPLASDHVAMLQEVTDVLASHPAGKGLRLVFQPDELELASNEVLVQRLEGGLITLIPIEFNDCTLDDTLHETQTLDPGDTAFNQYASSLESTVCITTANGTHVYVH